MKYNQQLNVSKEIVGEMSENNKKTHECIQETKIDEMYKYMSKEVIPFVNSGKIWRNTIIGIAVSLFLSAGATGITFLNYAKSEGARDRQIVVNTGRLERIEAILDKLISLGK